MKSVDPSLALQGAIVNALVAANVAGGRILDQPPIDAVYPYVTIGEGQVLADLADCYDGSECFLDIHVWSRAVGYPETKRIADQVRGVLHDADLVLDGHSLELLHFQDARTLRDPDGLTSHVAMTFRALTQPDT
jgi:hypothetical protein